MGEGLGGQRGREDGWEVGRRTEYSGVGCGYREGHKSGWGEVPLTKMRTLREDAWLYQPGLPLLLRVDLPKDNLEVLALPPSP